MHFMDSGNQSLNYVNEEEKHTNKQISFINFHNEEMRSKVFFFLLMYSLRLIRMILVTLYFCSRKYEIVRWPQLYIVSIHRKPLKLDNGR